MTGEKDAQPRTTFSLPVKADTFFGKCWWSDEVFPGSQQGYRDFVLISEFSELEGPVPLAVVSESTYVDLKDYTTAPSSTTDPSSEQHRQLTTSLHALGLDRFDFNAFALRVVSTDRSADCYDSSNLDKSDHTLISRTPATPSSLLEKSQTMDQQEDNGNNSTQSTFSIPDDTQVYFTDSDLKLYSFTHHLTLFDINARGYVHPVALSYITRDTEKIVSRFEDFMNRFNEVSRLMKKGNYTNFMLDLKYRLLDLEHTERILKSTEESAQSSTPLQVSNTSLSNQPTQLSTADEKNILIPSDTKKSSATAQGSTILTSAQIDKTPIFNTTAPNDNISTIDKDTNHQKKSSLSSISIVPRTSNNKEKIPKIITASSVTQSKERTIADDASIQKLQHPTSATVARKECLSKEALHQAQTVTRLMLDTMDTYATQWIRTSYDGDNSEDLSTDLEDDSPTSPTFIDKSHLVDSPETFEPSKDYQPKYVDTLYPVAHFDRKLRTLSQLCHEPDRDQILRHRHSNNNGHHPRSLPSTSVIPLVSIIEPQRRKTQKAVKRRLFDKNTNHDMYIEAIKYITDLTTELGRNSVALELEAEDTHFIEPLSQAMTFGRIFMLNLEDTHLRHEPSLLSPVSDHGSKMSVDTYNTNDQSSHLSISRRTAEGVETDDTDDDSPGISQEPAYYFPLRPTAQLWESKQKQNYGNLLYILQKHNQYIHHVIYSLMTGRPVVIMGNADGKSRIQEIVYALSIFVPGLSKQQHEIIPWFNGGKLNEGSLLSMKLVGTADTNVNPTLYQLDITCLEVDHSNGNGRLITSPLYLDGQWIYQLLAKIPFYTADESYIGFLHTMFMDISLLAYVYYHKYKDDDDDDSVDGYTYSTSTLSIDMRQNGKGGAHNSVSSYNGSPLEDDRRPLGKKWSVRRIVNYLKRVEDGEPEDYFGHGTNVNSSINTTNTSPMSTSTTPSTASISFVSANSSPIASSASSVSSSPSSASSLLQQRLSTSDVIGGGSTDIGTIAAHSIPAHILSQFEATTHRNHRHRHRHRQNENQTQQHSLQHPHHVTSEQKTESTPFLRLRQDETSSDHYSEDNDATVTLENIHNHSQLSVTQLNWNPPSPNSVNEETSMAATPQSKTTASPAIPSNNKLLSTQAVATSTPVDSFDATAISSSGSRRPSEVFSDKSEYSMSSISRRNSNSNTSSSYVSTFSYDGDDDYNMDLWQHFDNTFDAFSSDDNDTDYGSVHNKRGHSEERKQQQQKKQQQQQRQNRKSKKQLPDGGISMSTQSDTRSYSSERRGQTFLEQTFHVMGDDQAIVMGLQVKTLDSLYHR